MFGTYIDRLVNEVYMEPLSSGVSVEKQFAMARFNNLVNSINSIEDLRGLLIEYHSMVVSKDVVLNDMAQWGIGPGGKEYGLITQGIVDKVMQITDKDKDKGMEV